MPDLCFDSSTVHPTCPPLLCTKEEPQTSTTPLRILAESQDSFERHIRNILCRTSANPLLLKYIFLFVENQFHIKWIFCCCYFAAFPHRCAKIAQGFHALRRACVLLLVLCFGCWFSLLQLTNCIIWDGPPKLDLFSGLMIRLFFFWLKISHSVFGCFCIFSAIALNLLFFFHARLVRDSENTSHLAGSH